MATRGYLSKRSRKPNSSSQKSIVKNQRKKKLPPWDSTVSNLLVHKPTKEELRRRHELHQPVQRYSESPVGDSSSGTKLEPFKTPENMKNIRYSVLREIMSTNEKLQEALTYSDKKLSAVPDLFGDDPKKYRGFPSVTCAPGHKAENHSETVRKLAFMKEPSVGASHLDVLSGTIMDETALNNLSDLQQTTYEYDENNNSNVLSSGQCEQDLLDTSSTMRNSRPLPTSLSDPQIHSEGRTCNPENSDVRSEEKILPERKIQKENQDKKASGKQSSKPGALKGLYDLRETVDKLEEEIRLFEQETGREQTSTPFATEKASFGGFTTSILHAITKLVGYLRDCERQRKTESTLKEDLFLTIQQQQMLIDALTSEVICLQEGNRKLGEDLKASRETTEEQMKLIKRELYAVLKTREYETLSRDMDFLYDRQYSETAASQESLQDVIRSHGIRDNFEYLTTAKDGFIEARSTISNKENGALETNTGTTKETANEETTPKTFQTKSASNSITSSNSHASQIAGLSAPQLDGQDKTTENLNNQPPLDTVSHGTNTSVNNQAEQLICQTDSIAQSIDISLKNDQLLHHEKAQAGKYDMPCSRSPATPEVFTYYNPVHTNTLRSPTLPSSDDQYSQEDLQQSSLFISRNQTTSPHRRATKQGRQSMQSGSPADESHDENAASESPAALPALFERRMLPERPVQEKVVVRLPSMWKDYDAGMQRSAPGTSTTKQAVGQNSENGWFALSSHVGSR